MRVLSIKLKETKDVEAGLIAEFQGYLEEFVGESADLTQIQRKVNAWLEQKNQEGMTKKKLFHWSRIFMKFKDMHLWRFRIIETEHPDKHRAEFFILSYYVSGQADFIIRTGEGREDEAS